MARAVRPGVLVGPPRSLNPLNPGAGVGINGEAGWVEYDLLTYGANPRLTADGVQQAPVPLYDTDGTTVIGKADVSQSGP